MRKKVKNTTRPTLYHNRKENEQISGELSRSAAWLGQPTKTHRRGSPPASGQGVFPEDLGHRVTIYRAAKPSRLF